MSSNSSPSSSANESEAESNFQSAMEEIYEQKEESSVPAKEFDRRLPITHSYLGNTGQGELSSESIFVESENVINVPVLIMSEVCLLPGQTLPLQFYAQPSFQFLSDIGRQRYYFALLTYWDGMEPQNAAEFSLVPCHPIGTLFQIQNAFCKSENQMTIQVIGRQRCALISPIFRHNIFCEDVSSIICDKVAVRVLEEQLLPKQIIPTPECSFNRLSSKKERFKCQASLSPHDAFILWKLSTDGIVERLKKWLLFWFKRRQIDLLIEQGLTQFSYWVAANIPMSLDKKLELLGENSTDRRLRIEWHIISQMSSIVCTECEDPKCSVTDIINLSVEGNSAHFVNPGGFVHDLFTVDKLDKIELRGEPSAEFSWFPGYEWTIVECDHCRSHIGWRFTSSHHQLIPQQFYGISRRSFRLACTKESTE